MTSRGRRFTIGYVFELIEWTIKGTVLLVWAAVWMCIWLVKLTIYALVGAVGLVMLVAAALQSRRERHRLAG